MKNHELMDGELLQTNKKYSHLKIGQKESIRREEEVKKHKPEQVIFMNMCMVCDGEQVLALDKVGKSYNGTTFPGGHVEHGEIYADAVIREVYEETGLTIKSPVLKGIYHWYRDELHYVVLLYKAAEFEGKLISSHEGEVYWVPLEKYKTLSLAQGMDKVLQVMENDMFTECFMDVRPDGKAVEDLR